MKKLALIILGLGAAGLIGVFVWTWIHGPIFSPTDTRGQQGDFFGGHLSAIFGTLTLWTVLYFGWQQRKDEQRSRTRENMLAGLDLIAQYDLKSPACEQAMRALDYYSKIAMEESDAEWFWMLNIVITKEIRSTLERLEHEKREIYVHAQQAHRRIGEILSDYHKLRKGVATRR